ncbi:MAG: polyprenyl synthetase family protein [Clostridiales Family XIII bacterium]|nr:polyprenyl synthetase family protein [Clostridiales Family XIII bacterium]
MLYYGDIDELENDIGRVDAYMAEYLHDTSMNPMLNAVLETIIATKGKKVRPLLLLLAGRFGPQWPESRDRLCKMAACIEMIHMASLIHDDIVDDAPTRRGRETVQSRFGKDMAVYAGDFVMSRILYYLFREATPETGMLLAKTVESMCYGEMCQLTCNFNTETTMSDYLSNIYGKTASLFIATCRIGAAESGCGVQSTEVFSEIGKHIGYLFQLRDDLLNFVSNVQREGKPVFTDFLNGTYTLPILHTLGHPHHGSRLKEMLRAASFGGASAIELEEIRSLIIQCKGIEFTRSMIRAHAAEARELLTNLPRKQAARGIRAMLDYLEGE